MAVDCANYEMNCDSRAEITTLSAKHFEQRQMRESFDSPIQCGLLV